MTLPLRIGPRVARALALGVRECSRCGVEKSVEEFQRFRTRGILCLRRVCNACVRARMQNYSATRRTEPEAKVRQHEFNIRKYGLNRAAYEALLQGQDGRCAICREPPPPERRLAVDHDHETGVVRGLLCMKCNTNLAWHEQHGATASGYLARASSGWFNALAAREGSTLLPAATTPLQPDVLDTLARLFHG